MSPEPVHARPMKAATIALLEASGLPTSDLTDEHMQDFFFCGPASAPVAVVGVQFCGADALLRSLAVTPDRRSCGLGAALVRHVENFARERGAGSLYLLTTTAEAFFRRRGYVAADRQSAPAEIRATREFSAICPANSAFLVKQL